jgi:hypothetical protein
MPDSPFGAPSGAQLEKAKLQRPSFQEFVSGTPLPGYVFDPRLALYIDPNMPANLYPRFIHVAEPTAHGSQDAVIPVGAGSPTPTAFINQVRGTGTLEPRAAAQVQAASQQPSQSPDPFGGWGDVLMGPSQRPNEPITTGLPFGDGSAFLRMPGEDDTRFRSRVVQALLGSPSADAAVKAFALRMQRGE